MSIPTRRFRHIGLIGQSADFDIYSADYSADSNNYILVTHTFMKWKNSEIYIILVGMGL